MKSTWGIIIALGCGVAALAFVMFVWRPDVALDASPAVAPSGSGADRARSDERGAGGAAAGPRAGSASTAPGNGRAAAPGGGTRPSDKMAGAQRERLRGRLPAAIAGAQKGTIQRGGGQIDDAGTGAVGDLDRTFDPSDASADAIKDRLSHHDLPPAGSPDTESAAGAVKDADAEPAPEVAYDGGADHVFDTAARAEITDAGRIDGNAGTIAFWIDPQWQPNAQEDASFVQLGDNGLQIVKSGSLLRFEFIDDSGMRHGGSADIADWQPGEWRHVAGAWNGGTFSLFVDGGQVFLNSGPTPPNIGSDTKLFVGSALPNGAPAAAGQLAYLTVMNRDVSVEEVRQMFQSGRAPSQ